jgi:hypothetical protein
VGPEPCGPAGRGGVAKIRCLRVRQVARGRSWLWRRDRDAGPAQAPQGRVPWAWGPSVVGAHEGSRKEEVSVGGMQSGLTHTDKQTNSFIENSIEAGILQRHKMECTVHTGGERKLGWVTDALRGERAGAEIRDQVSAWSQQIVQSLQAKSKTRFWLVIGKERMTR